MNVEETINKKLAKVVSVGGLEKSPKSPKVERRSPPSIPDSPQGAEGELGIHIRFGDYKQETRPRIRCYLEGKIKFPLLSLSLIFFY